MGDRDLEISVWSGIYDAAFRENRATMTIPELISIVQGDTYKELISKIRAEQSPEKRKTLKESLPAVTCSGVFKERKLTGLIKHSGMICMDFDNLGTEMQPIKNAMRSDKNIFAFFTSASGKGLAVLVRIEPHLHKESFEALEVYFYEKYNLVSDAACKDVSRLRFLSHDPEAHIFTSSFVYNKLPKPALKPKKHYISVPATLGDISKIVAQANDRKLDITDGSYAEWMRLGMSLATLGEQGRCIFHAMSQHNSKYKEGQCDKAFTSMIGNHNGNITIGTFYYFAKRAGLDTNPEKPRAIIDICKKTKRKKDGAVDDAINQLKSKNIICVDDDNEKASEDDIALVRKVYNETEIEENEGIGEIESYIMDTWKFRKNEITGNIEWCDTGNAFEDSDYATIYIETKKQYPSVKRGDVMDIICAKTETYNPLKDFIETNRDKMQCGGLIRELAACIGSDSGMSGDIFDVEYEEYFLKKWIVGMIASIYGGTSPLLLALVGAQNVGKSEFFRRLLPAELRKYYAEIKLSMEKDAAMDMTKYLVILDDELSGKSKMEERHLNELTSRSMITFRPPYGRASIQRKRLAVLCGTTNEEAIISDSFGNRRIIPIKVNGMDFERLNKIDRTALFMEAFWLYENGEKWELTKDDIDRLNKNTGGNIAENTERELLIKHYANPMDSDLNGVLKPVVDILVELQRETNLKLTAKKIGTELRIMKYECTDKRIDGKRLRCYRVSPRNFSVIPQITIYPQS